MSQPPPRRRQTRRAPAAEPPPPPESLLKRRDLAGAGLLGGTVALAISAALIFGRSGSDTVSTGQPPATAQPAATATEVLTAADQQAIEALARRSIEVLPAGQWPSLYDDFTPDFQGRCPRAEFDQAGVDAAQQLGASLQLLAYKRLEELKVDGSSASAVIIGELQGQGEYKTGASFQNIGGWKLAPAPGTDGCSAFNRISG